mgnify:CR=1 FL=1
MRLTTRRVVLKQQELQPLALTGLLTLAPLDHHVPTCTIHRIPPNPYQLRLCQTHSCSCHLHPGRSSINLRHPHLAVRLHQASPHPPAAACTCVGSFNHSPPKRPNLLTPPTPPTHALLLTFCCCCPPRALLPVDFLPIGDFSSVTPQWDAIYCYVRVRTAFPRPGHFDIDTTYMLDATLEFNISKHTSPTNSPVVFHLSM